MNIKILHFKCQTVVREAYQEYRRSIENAVFEVDETMIEVELKIMKQTIGIKMNNWASDCDFSEKQYDYLQNVIKYYLDIALKKH